MNLELKSVKINNKMSQETFCFSATICVDGKAVGTVMNRGFGGPDEYDWKDEAVGERVQAWAKSQGLEVDYMHMDQIIGNLLNDFQKEQWMKRACRTKVLFRRKGDKSGTWRTFKVVFSDAVRQKIVAMEGDKLECIANDDIAKAARLFA